MRRFTPVALLALMIVPAVALAGSTDKFTGDSPDEKKVRIKFDVKKDKVDNFQARKVRFKCDDELKNGKKRFVANPPEFEDRIDVDSDGDFDDSYSFTENIDSKDDPDARGKFKGKVDGTLDERNNKKSNRRSKYDEGDGDMKFDVRYTDGDNTGVRCESDTIDWDAELK